MVLSFLNHALLPFSLTHTHIYVHRQLPVMWEDLRRFGSWWFLGAAPTWWHSARLLDRLHLVVEIQFWLETGGGVGVPGWLLKKRWSFYLKKKKKRVGSIWSGVCVNECVSVCVCVCESFEWSFLFQRDSPCSCHGWCLEGGWRARSRKSWCG